MKGECYYLWKAKKESVFFKNTCRYGLSSVGLLLTLVLIFAFQGNTILENPLHIVLIAVPLVLQTFFVFAINDACVMAKKPFSHAGIIRFKGQLMTYVPGEGPCYRCVFKNPPPKDAVPTCKQAGVIGAMGGVIGSLQAMEAVKYILGVGDLLTGYLLTFDAITMEFRKIKLPSGEKHLHPEITELIDYEQTECEGI